MGKKSSSSPDVTGAASIEGEFARETARDVTYADRPNQNNPFGNTSWSTERVIDPATGAPTTKWTQNQSLSAPTQNIFDSQLSNNAAFSDMAGGKMGAIENEMGAPANFDEFGSVIGFDPTANRQEAEDASYARSTSRLDPRFAEEQQRFDVQMANRGLRQGDSAYDTAFDNFSRGKNDAYEQARLGSVGEGRQEVGVNLSTNERANALRSQEIEEFLGKRGQSLSEAQALQDSMNTEELTNTFAGGS
jgi:hypothetical protein